MQAPDPHNETQRLAALYEYSILDSPSEKPYDDLTFLALQVCESPIALISLIDENRQWFKSKIGIDFNETSRDLSFCAHTILRKDLFIVNDAAADARFAQNPLVRFEPKIRFYAGAPLTSGSGQAVGSICVMDFKPRQLTDAQLEALRALARQCVTLLELRKAADQEAAGSREIFESFVESAFDGYCIHENGIILEGNERAARLFGYTRDELIGMNVLQVVAPEFRPQVASKITNRDEAPYYEVTGLRKDGSRFPMEAFVKNQTYNGTVRRVVVCRDITDRKKTEELIKEREKRFRALIENSADGIALMRPDGSFEYVSPSNERIAGYSNEELLSHGFQEYIHPDDAVTMQEVWRRTISSPNESVVGQCRYLHKDGTWHWLEFVNKNLLHDAAVRAIVSNYRDITERKKAEQALLESEEKYRALFEESQDAVFISTPIGEFIDINPAGVEMFGYASKEEFLKIHILRDLFSNPNDRHGFSRLMRDQGFVTDFELHLKKKNGEPLIVLETSTAVRNEAGEIVQYRGTMRDVTRLKQLQQQLVQSQKMETIGQLAGGVAHDFNNILMAIMGYCELITMKLSPNDGALQYVDETIRAAERGASLTKQLLAFSSKQMLAPRLMNLNETLLGMRNLLKRLIGEDVQLITHLNPDLGAVKVDPSQIEQVIMNLAINSRHAMPNGGELMIETVNAVMDESFTQAHLGSVKGSYVMLRITDTGCGMDEETMSHIFEPFFTTKEKGKGTGLGLSTVYGIVKQSKGYITVQSSLGLGTSFQIFLPRIDEQVPVAESSSITNASTDHTILLVDDDENVRKSTAASLQMKGFRVLEARDGNEALGIFHNYDGFIELLITDVVMPNMGGKELATQIRKEFPEIKVLFISGYSGEAIVREDSGQDGMAFLQKPATIQVLMQKIHQLLL